MPHNNSPAGQAYNVYAESVEDTIRKGLLDDREKLIDLAHSLLIDDEAIADVEDAMIDVLLDKNPETAQARALDVVAYLVRKLNKRIDEEAEILTRIEID